MAPIPLDPASVRTPAARRVLPDLLLMAVVWIAMIVLVDPVGDFPINDDWVYAAAVKGLMDTGRFEILSFSSANVGPLVYWGALFSWLFGFSYTALRFSTLVLGLAGGVFVYFLFLELWKHRSLALVAALAVLVNPIYFALSNTFMTDVPFYAAMAGSILAIVVGLQRNQRLPVAIGLVVAVGTVLLRQFAVVVPAGFALAYVARHGVRPRTVVKALIPLVVALLLNWAFNQWLMETGRKPGSPGVPTLLQTPAWVMLWLVRLSMFNLLSYLGLFLLPVILVCLPRVTERRDRMLWVAALVVAAALGAVYVQRHFTVPLGENVLNWYGIGPLANGDTLMDNLHLPVKTPGVAAAWLVVTALTVVASGWVVVTFGIGIAALWRRLRGRWFTPKPTPLVLAYFLIGTGLAYLAVLLLVAAGYTLFDRYMLPLALVVGCAVPLLGSTTDARVAAWSSSRWRVGAAFAVLACWCVFSVVTTHDYLRWSDARWTALHALMAEGVAPRQIDGGYEFDGTYLYDPHYRKVPGKNWWWIVDDEYLVAAGPMPGYHAFRSIPVERWWPGLGTQLFILQRD